MAITSAEFAQLSIISLGSNKGFRLKNLIWAKQRLSRLSIGALYTSAIYETAPIDCLTGAWFLNAAVAFKTNLSGKQLLRFCLDLEAKKSRRRPYPNAPRPLDADIIFHKNEVFSDDFLTLPHPRYHLRRFVLQPLCDFAADQRPPDGKLELQQLLTQVKDEGVIKTIACW